MSLPLGQFAPEIKLGFVSASRDCFPRELSETRSKRLIEACREQDLSLLVPQGECAVVENKAHAAEAARQLAEAGCQAAVLYLGNFSPEIEDAAFVRAFPGPVMLLAAAEETGENLIDGRGDALCGLLSATMAIERRGLDAKVHLPERPVVSTGEAVVEIARFLEIMQVVVGARGATLGLFGPRPRDFETCQYSIAALASIGIEVEELALFDLANEIDRIKKEDETGDIESNMREQIANIPGGDFGGRLSAYERALLNFREKLNLSGAATQCWSEQEFRLGHVPCFINGRLASRGFPVACENDAYSLAAELLAQYASGGGATVLDINHSIPRDLSPQLPSGAAAGDLVGMFHCGNTDPARLKGPEMRYQLIMKRLMEPDNEPDITRGTIEGQIAASPITVTQIQANREGTGLRAYVAEGEFLDLDPKTFGCTGTAQIPGFARFYRHALLGRFHHHAAVAFRHCGSVLYDAFKLMGIREIYTPLPEGQRYPGENPFR